MKENDFNLDTTVREKKVFLKKIRIVFTAALFLTGVLSFLGLMMSAWGIKTGSGCKWAWPILYGIWF